MPDEIKSYVGQKGVPQAEFFHLDAEVCRIDITVHAVLWSRAGMRLSVARS